MGPMWTGCRCWPYLAELYVRVGDNALARATLDALDEIDPARTMRPALPILAATRRNFGDSCPELGEQRLVQRPITLG